MRRRNTARPSCAGYVHGIADGTILSAACICIWASLFRLYTHISKTVRLICSYRQVYSDLYTHTGKSVTYISLQESLFRPPPRPPRTLTNILAGMTLKVLEMPSRQASYGRPATELSDARAPDSSRPCMGLAPGAKGSPLVVYRARDETDCLISSCGKTVSISS